MAIYNGNNDTLIIDGFDMGSVRRAIQVSPAIEAVDVSAGSGIEWRERAEGLGSVEMTFFIGYPVDDPVMLARVLEVTKPGRHYVVYGPDGNAAGKPRFACEMIFTGAPHDSNHEKSDGRGFNVAATSAKAPDAYHHGGDTF